MVDRISAEPVVALVTHAGLPALTDDDRLLAASLGERGARTTAVVWSDAEVDWTAYDAIVVRSCWDYFLRADEFFQWLARLEDSGAHVLNPVRTLRWNAEKTYLRQLEAAGIPVVPTRWLEPGASESLSDIRRRTGWSELVVKPAISGSAHETWRASPGAGYPDEIRLGTMTASGCVLVQPLVDVISADGEWSIVFIDGEYSHAVLKRPQSGDFHVQIEHGGTFSAMEPPEPVLAQARAALRAASAEGEEMLYARVDGCVVDDDLLLMELELIEPVLFLGTSAGAADRLADAVLARIGQGMAFIKTEARRV
jgi:glutathione synthase/RimK-type ligase-like ATP-grasp enzyme